MRSQRQSLQRSGGTAAVPSAEAGRKVWKTITLGQFANTFALRNALDAAGCGIGDLAAQILARQHLF